MSKENVSAFLKKYTMVIVLVIVTLFFTWKTGGRMLLPQNVNNLISQNSYVFILATGMLLCILTGGNIDLSVGSVVCFAGAVGATFMVNKGMSVGVSILIMLVTGLVDVFHGNGINITCILAGIIIAAVFVLMTFKGRMSKIKKGYKVGPAVNDIVKCAVISIVIIAFMWRLAQYKGIPMILIWVALIVLIYGYLTSKTTVGRHLYAIGGNEKAAQLSGINTNKVYFIAYANMGLLAAVAAMAVIARLNSANPTAGDGYEMDAIGSCFIGGASAYGGSGTIPGVIIGATLMGVINLGMSIMGVDANWQ